MLAREPIRATGAHPSHQRDAATAVSHALDLLSRASENWRGNDATEVGSLHWPVVVNLARRELSKALEALELDA